MCRDVVALPGTLCAPSIFDRLAHCLEPGATLDAVAWLTEPGPWDIPSVAARLADRLRHRARDRVLLVGHSTGGAIAAQLAVAAPELIRGVVLIDSGAHMRGHGDVGTILHRVDTAWGEGLRAAVIDRCFHRSPSAVDREQFLAWARRVDRRAVHAVLSSQQDLDLTAALTTLAVPALVIHGRHDPTRTVHQAEELAAAIPGARLELLDAGHSPMYELPARVADLLRRFALSDDPPSQLGSDTQD